MTLPEFTGILKWGAPCLAVFARHGIAVVEAAALSKPARSEVEGSSVARLTLPDAPPGMNFSSTRCAA
jgi:hypothetical protein